MLFNQLQNFFLLMKARSTGCLNRHARTLVLGFFCLVFPMTSLQADDSPALSDSELEAVVAEIRATSEAAAIEMAGTRSDRLDAAVPVEAADFDPQKIFQWISSETRWVPYVGILRGAQGVLADRQGNALDRSLLLAEFFKLAGIETRLANTQLSADVAAELVKRESGKPVLVGVKYPLTDAGQQVVDRSEQQTQKLLSIAGLVRPPNPQIAIDAAKDHWWVQTKTDNEWKDFDPLFPDSIADKRPQSEAFFASENLPEGLPGELFHHVTLRVVIERFENGNFAEEIPVELNLKASDGISQPISLHFEPYGTVPPVDGIAWLMEATTLADSAQDWMPVFRLNGKRTTDMGFGRDGKLESNPAKPTQNRKLGTAVSSLGGLGAGSKNKQPDSVLSGCWIEYELTKPNSKPEKIRRTIFSFRHSGGGNQRDISELNSDTKAVRERGLALLGSHQVLVTSSDLPMVLFDHSLLEFWGKTGNLIAGVVRVSNDPGVEEPNQRLAGGTVFPMDLLSLAVMRDVLSPDAGLTYLGQANIFSNHYLYNENKNFPEHAWDIVFNRVGVFPLNREATTVSMRQGVLDTILESTLLPVPPDSERYNTARLFDRQDETGPWRLWQLGDEANSGFSKEAIAYMTSALAANRLVVAPRHLPDSTKAVWWEIDPQNYTTLGIGPRGWGTETGEYGVINVPSSVQAAYTRTQGQAVCTGVAVATTALTLMVPEVRGTFRTLPSIIAQSKPLLRTHCLVQGWWTPP